MNILIVGLGNIGKRHLQSILKNSTPLNIYLFDISRIQFKSKHRNHKIYILNKLPKNLIIELLIIATTSKDRYKLFNKISIDNKINKIVIEKIAFLNKRHYLSALKYKNLFINYPRPLMKSYSYLKKYLNSETIKSLSVYGHNWNLLSNTPHFMNLFFYLTNKNLTKLDAFNMHDRIYNSKRKGFHELKGSLIFKNNMSQYLLLFDSSKYKKNFIKISTNNFIIKIYESISLIKIYNKKLNLTKNKKFYLELQSDLTNKSFLETFNSVSINYISLNKCIQNELLYLDFLKVLKKSNIKFKEIKYS